MSTLGIRAMLAPVGWGGGGPPGADLLVPMATLAKAKVRLLGETSLCSSSLGCLLTVLDAIGVSDPRCLNPATFTWAEPRSGAAPALAFPRLMGAPGMVITPGTPATACGLVGCWCLGKLDTRKLPILHPASFIFLLNALAVALAVEEEDVDAEGEVGSVAARARLAWRRLYDPGETQLGLELLSSS